MGRMRAVLLHLLHWTGLFRLWMFLHRNHIAILMIHGVMADDGARDYVPLRPSLAPAQLERYLRLLSRYYTFISLEEAEEILSGRKPPRPCSIVLTFDDAYRNGITHALPVLRRFGAPMTIFVPTGLVTRREPLWVDRLDFAVQFGLRRERVVELDGHRLVLTPGDREHTARSFATFRRKAKGIQCPDADFLAVVTTVAETLEADAGKSLVDIWADDDWSALLTWDQIKEHHGDGVSFGSHTVDHARLNRMPGEESMLQLSDSKAALEDALGCRCRHFAYPDGAYDDDAADQVRRAGFASAVTTEEGLNAPGCDLYRLRRVGVPLRSSDLDFLSRVTGISDVLSRLVGRLRRVLRRK